MLPIKNKQQLPPRIKGLDPSLGAHVRMREALWRNTFPSAEHEVKTHYISVQEPQREEDPERR